MLDGGLLCEAVKSYYNRTKKEGKIVEILLILLSLTYTAWAIYSGYKVLSGRSKWLDKKESLNIAVKVVLSIGTGYVIGAFYLLYLLLKFLMSRM